MVDIPQTIADNERVDKKKHHGGNPKMIQPIETGPNFKVWELRKKCKNYPEDTRFFRVWYEIHYQNNVPKSARINSDGLEFSASIEYARDHCKSKLAEKYFWV